MLKGLKKFIGLILLTIIALVSRGLSWMDNSQFSTTLWIIAGLFFVIQGATDFAEMKFKVGAGGIDIETDAAKQPDGGEK